MTSIAELLDRDAVEKIQAHARTSFDDNGYDPDPQKIDALCDLALEALSSREATEGGEAVHQCREIGEGDWRDCTKSEYDRLQTDPHHDTRTITRAPEGEPTAQMEAMLRRAFMEGRESTAGTDRHYGERAWGNSSAKRAAAALRSASIPPSGVAVKTLEWEMAMVPPSGEWLARSPAGLYSIPLGSGQYPLHLRDGERMDQFSTLEEAQAAAQADYEARISSALTAVPSGVAEAHAEALEAAREAALDAWHTAEMEEASELGIAHAVPAAITAYLAALGDGWRLVPVEPTEAMLSAIWSVRASNGSETTRECYRAMLAAAPTPPGEKK